MADSSFPFPLPTNSILNERYTRYVCDITLKAALHCMILGDVKQGNRIVDFLYEHNIFEYTTWTAIRDCLHLAWAASGFWPTPYTSPQRNKISPARTASEHGESLPAALRSKMSAKVREVVGKLDDQQIDFNDFAKARKESSELSMDFQRDEAQAANLEIAFELSLDDVIGEMVRQHLVSDLLEKPSGFNLSRAGILASPRIWGLLVDGWVRKELSLSHDQIETYAGGILQLLDERLTKGAMASLKENSIEELCRIFDEQCLANKKMGNRGGCMTFRDKDAEIGPKDIDDRLPPSFLKGPASPSAIANLDAQAQENGFENGLPEDFKAFLQTTDGIYAYDRKADNHEIFQPVSELEFGDAEIFLGLELLPNEVFARPLDTDVEWPEWPTVRALHVGAGGDEGVQYLIPRSELQEGLEVFEEMYRNASAEDRMRLERAANDIYGGVEELRNMEYVVIRMYHWAAECEAFKDFRSLLESTVADVLDLQYEKEEGEGNSGSDEEEEDGEDDDEELDDAEDDGEEVDEGDDGDEGDVNEEGQEDSGEEEEGIDAGEEEGDLDDDLLEDGFDETPAEAAKRRHQGHDVDSNKRQKLTP